MVRVTAAVIVMVPVTRKRMAVEMRSICITSGSTQIGLRLGVRVEVRG